MKDRRKRETEVIERRNEEEKNKQKWEWEEGGEEKKNSIWTKACSNGGWRGNTWSRWEKKEGEGE